MIESYLPVLILLIVAILMPTGMIISSQILGPKLRGGSKNEPYECGVPAVGSPREGFAIKFYKIAILFLLFDVEAALLFPWAVIFKEKLPTWGPTFLVVEFMFFLIILVGGYAYAWKRHGLEWE